MKEEVCKVAAQGIVLKVVEPTPWWLGMVPILKKSGSVLYLCGSKRLNSNVLQEALGQLAGAEVYPVNWMPIWDSGKFLLQRNLLSWQLFSYSLANCFNNLPFVICSAPEHFQKQMSRVLEGLEGVICLIDDLVCRANQKAHDSRLKAVMERMERAGVTLNSGKCRLASHNSSGFLVTLLTSRESQQTRRRELVCVRWEPLLMSQSWDGFLAWPTNWAVLTQPGWTLTILEGSFLLHMIPHWRQRSQLMPLVSWHAQIEKEALATVWACENFLYILGKKILIELTTSL